MNKEKFIKELEKVTGLDNGKCIIINSILESNYIVGKKNREKIMCDVMEQLEMSREEAEKIYEFVMSILGNGIKDKLRHPFGTQD
ncbi:MAG: hypothetical protein HFJ40_06325 [Clostridia bacterium]|nr:hypothetical protein [Clostridia bacterium]